MAAGPVNGSVYEREVPCKDVPALDEGTAEARPASGAGAGALPAVPQRAVRTARNTR
jgi:hypothetical protein